MCLSRNLLIYSLTILAAAVVAPGQEETVYSVKDPGVSTPVVVYKVEPKYTEAAKEAKVQGMVVLNLEVTKEGSADKIAVKEGLAPDLDQNAIEAVRQWRFKPGTKNGEPVRVKAAVEINFRLN
jgi:periplasmic protein TonB